MKNEQDPYFEKFTPIQKEHFAKGCPECGGHLHGTQDGESNEIYLWCDDCLVSMDSDGGYTK